MIPTLPTPERREVRTLLDPSADESSTVETVYYPDGRVAGHREVRRRSGRPDLLMALTQHGLPFWLAAVFSALPLPLAGGLYLAAQQSEMTVILLTLLAVVVLGVDGLIATLVLFGVQFVVALSLLTWGVDAGVGGVLIAYGGAVLASLLVLAPAWMTRR